MKFVKMNEAKIGTDFGWRTHADSIMLYFGQVHKNRDRKYYSLSKNVLYFDTEVVID